ncbi:hypothetical protein GYMLUDRAFT_596687 [Collybiopsis luxurians FD-317 M1]|uniref:Uncharacterized protein n=1 Tax=Collybiopsis luxurians FD-317 M1 TaxID=944289 RepID=A0A0D0BYG0_9AGAR|nr:hypothetical protein GYMLUDRAFT_596687 [Collybiopsis luxurians FD-317 M1]
MPNCDHEFGSDSLSVTSRSSTLIVTSFSGHKSATFILLFLALLNYHHYHHRNQSLLLPYLVSSNIPFLFIRICSEGLEKVLSSLTSVTSPVVNLDGQLHQNQSQRRSLLLRRNLYHRRHRRRFVPTPLDHHSARPSHPPHHHPLELISSITNPHFHSRD